MKSITVLIIAPSNDLNSVNITEEIINSVTYPTEQSVD